MKQPTGMANMAPGFLIWLAKTNCFFLSQLTHHASASSCLFYIKYQSTIFTHLCFTLTISHHFFCKIFTPFTHQYQHSTNKKSTKKTHTRPLYHIVIISIFFLTLSLITIPSSPVFSVLVPLAIGYLCFAFLRGFLGCPFGEFESEGLFGHCIIVLLRKVEDFFGGVGLNGD